MIPALAAAALLLIAAVPAVAQIRHPMLVDDKSASVVEVTSVYSYVPPTGYAPIRVKAVNNTTGEMTVNLDMVAEGSNGYSDDHQLESRYSFTAAASKTTEREFLVPLCTNYQISGYSEPVLRVNLQAGGRRDNFRFATGGYGNMPFVVFSTALAGKSIRDINSGANSSSSSSYSHGNENFAGMFDPGQLSADWRGYSGLDALGISSAEWTALPANNKSAILQWVKLGGALNIYSERSGSGFETLGIAVQGEAAAGPDYGGTAYQLGNGRVCDIKWDGTALGSQTAKYYVQTGSGGVRDQDVRRQEYAESLSGTEQSEVRPKPNNRTPVVDALGEKSFAAWQVGVILFIFGIVVGPVNLFYFAGKGRRHRLFFTTPIISLAAAALLLVVIFFQDGTGGDGHRASLVYLDSAENAAFIHQMQVSRTGVIFGSSFTLDDTSVLNMGVMPDTRWTRLKGPRDTNYSYPYPRSGGYYGRGEAQHYSVQDGSCGGDWFQSRSEQAQFLDAVQSTRGRIELKPGSNPPVITSTIGAPLKRVCYVDQAGNRWASAGEVTTGAEVTLTPIAESNFTDWRNTASASLPKDLREAIRAHGGKGFFYASSSDPKAGMVETLDSIDWETNDVFLYGPLK